MQKFELFSQFSAPLQKARGEHVFRQGEQDRNFYIIKSGLLKAYYLSHDGKEQVKSLLMPGAFIGSMTACHSKQACSFSLSCLESSELLSLSFDDLREMTKSNMDVAQFMLNSLLDLAMKKERREYELLCLSAKERYRLLLEHEPALLERVTQNDIARYLGITPVALSRIKSRI